MVQLPTMVVMWIAPTFMPSISMLNSRTVRRSLTPFVASSSHESISFYRCMRQIGRRFESVKLSYRFTRPILSMYILLVQSFTYSLTKEVLCCGHRTPARCGEECCDPNHTQSRSQSGHYRAGRTYGFRKSGRRFRVYAQRKALIVWLILRSI